MNSFLERHADKWEAITETSCFIWTAALNHNGYGHAWDGERVRRAHRASLISSKGPPPSGTQASHLCNVKSCVNPDHLIWETRSENEMRKSPAVRHATAVACGAALRANARGCYFNREKRKWYAQARIDSKVHFIGYFATEAEGTAAYNIFTGRQL